MPMTEVKKKNKPKKRSFTASLNTNIETMHMPLKVMMEMRVHMYASAEFNLSSPILSMSGNVNVTIARIKLKVESLFWNQGMNCRR